MSIGIIPAFAFALMVLIAIASAPRFRAERLPMQWGFDGRPTWYAPRLVALWFPVGIAAFVIACTALAAEPGEGWIVVLAAAVSLATQLIYLFLLERWRRKN